MHFFKSKRSSFCGNSRLKHENISNCPLSYSHAQQFILLRICPKKDFKMMLCVFLVASRHAHSECSMGPVCKSNYENHKSCIDFNAKEHLLRSMAFEVPNVGDRLDLYKIREHLVAHFHQIFYELGRMR